MPLVEYLARGRSIENVTGKGRYKLPEIVRRNLDDRDPGAAPEGAAAPPGAETRSFLQDPPAALIGAPAGPSETPVAPAVRPEPASRPAQAGRWTLALKRGRNNVARKARGTAVQREFNLEAVRPLRNDLNDSDVEAVLAEAQPLTGGQSDELGSGPPSVWRSWPAMLMRRMRSWMA